MLNRILRCQQYHKIAVLKKYAILTRCSSNSPHAFDTMSPGEASIDSSINTMEQILTILHKAHGLKPTSRESAMEFYDTDPISFERDFFISLGEDVFSLRTVNALIDLQLKGNVEIFMKTHPSHTKKVIRQYVSAFKSQYSRSPSSSSMRALGYAFKENPRRTNAALDQAIRDTASKAMTDDSPLNQCLSIDLENCRVKLYNPFRNGTTDPFSLRKGLSTKKHPSNLLGVLISDHQVLSSFLKKLKRIASPSVLQNIMIAQSLYGNIAFRVIVKRRLATQDPRDTLDTFFEPHHFGIVEERTDLNKLKAIVAYRSMIMNRLEWFSPYRKSIAMLDENKFDSTDKINVIMADLFNRFFGLCYKSDAKYCEGWVNVLMDFCISNKGNKTFMNRLHDESVAGFLLMIAKLKFEMHGSRWRDESYLSSGDSFGEAHQASRDFLKEARKFVQN